MPASRFPGEPPNLRHRSTAALVLSRPDPAAGTAPHLPATPEAAPRRPVWAAVLVWVVLGAAIAGVWALLLLGDSLPVSG